MTYIQWLETVTGRTLLQQESVRVSLALESIFGDQFLQIGAWGGNEFRQFARTKRTAVSGDVVGAEVDLVMAENCLAIANDSIDIILLPHVLETSDARGVA